MSPAYCNVPPCEKRHSPTCRDDDARCLDQIACSVPQLAGSGKMCDASLARVAKRECFQTINAGHAARGVAANHGSADGRRERQRLLERKKAEGALACPPPRPNRSRIPAATILCPLTHLQVGDEHITGRMRYGVGQLSVAHCQIAGDATGPKAGHVARLEGHGVAKVWLCYVLEGA